MLNATLWSDEDLTVLQVELSALYDSTLVSIRAVVAGIVRQSATDLSDRFYRAMLLQSRAQFYLDHEIVSLRLRAALKNWMIDIFRGESVDAAQIVRRQLEIGSVHARIQVPTSLVMHGMRELKRGIYGNLKHARLPHEDIAQAVFYASALLDVALGVMTAAYVSGSERSTRSSEALRQFSIGQDLPAERERQRALLAEWAQNAFFAAQMPDETLDRLHLGQSEFGLWFFHRASLLFGQSSEYASIAEAIERVDSLAGRVHDSRSQGDRQALLREIKQRVDQISALLTMLFERSLDVGSTRDPLTRLPSRRFLRTAVSREISLQGMSRRPFSLIMIEIDNFARLRTRLGEAGADVVVQQTAAMLFNAVRSSDSVFSMGRETFLIIRVEANAQEATAFARALVEAYAATHFEVDGKTVLDNSLSVGVAAHDGHPDPRHLIDRATLALRNAKKG